MTWCVFQYKIVNSFFKFSVPYLTVRKLETMSPHWRKALVELFAENVSSSDADLAYVSGATSIISVDADQIYAWRRTTKDVLTVNLKTLAGGVLTAAQKVKQILKPNVEVDFDVVGMEVGTIIKFIIKGFGDRSSPSLSALDIQSHYSFVLASLDPSDGHNLNHVFVVQ